MNAEHPTPSRRGFLAGGLAIGGVAALSACGVGDSPAPEKSLKISPGGRLRVGVAGAGSTESFPGPKMVSYIDVIRTRQVYERLTTFDPSGQIVNELAQDFKANDSLDTWTMRLIPDVKFSDGKELTAADVVYTFRWHMDKKNASLAANAISNIDPSRVRKVDDRTVEFGLFTPNALFPQDLVNQSLVMMPEGTTDFRNPIGTGPYVMESFDPGSRMVFGKNPHYRIEGRPYLDRLEIVSVDDPDARVAALTSGQLDVIGDVSPLRAREISQSPSLTLAASKSGFFLEHLMSCTQAPFNDVRVRQAMRLLVDREELVQNAFQGYAMVGNDMPSWFDTSAYPDVPQRTYDPDQARSLLKAAGREDLVIDLFTGKHTAGLLEIGTLSAQQAKAAGVTIKVHDQAEQVYYAEDYAIKPFFSDYVTGGPYWFNGPRLQLKDAPYNAAGWVDPDFERLYAETRRTPDQGRQFELMREMQTITYERGACIIPVFPDFLDAHTKKVGGLKKSVVLGLGYHNFVDAHVLA
ncbi:ABC transporter substrate-binding protein [Nocardioides sp.]|uniref:ABC transporter substrate-binding protein n=1 Tax=Nocardioides sp. TaxID=35761 RepID=UPI003D137592